MESYPWENIKSRLDAGEVIKYKDFKIIVHPYDLLREPVRIKETLDLLKKTHKMKYQVTSISRTGNHAYEFHR
jgi:hypothetical protein